MGRVGRRTRGFPRRRPGRRRLLPRPVESRQDRPVDPRGQLHRFVLVEGVRQGRHQHLGDTGDRLSQYRSRPARVRAARLPARRRLLLVHVLPHPGPLPVRPRRARRDVPRGEGPAPRPRAGLGRRDGRSAPAALLPAGPRQGRPRPGVLGRGAGDRRGGPRAHHQDVRPRPVLGLLPHPGDVDGQPLRGHALHSAHRRRDDIVLRLVRRPAGRESAGLRRPDRRPRIR